MGEIHIEVLIVSVNHIEKHIGKASTILPGYIFECLGFFAYINKGIFLILMEESQIILLCSFFYIIAVSAFVHI